jgi:hypothetical protein
MESNGISPDSGDEVKAEAAPDSGVRLTANQAYRLRCKLRAALTRLIEVLLQFAATNQRPDFDTGFMAASVIDMLDGLTRISMSDPDGNQRLNFSAYPMLVDLLKKQVHKRRKESSKRKRRRQSQAEKDCL